MEISDIVRKYNLLNSKFSGCNRSLSAIKSNLMYKCKEVAEEEDSALDTGPFCCKWCMNVWTPSNCTVTLRPQKHPKHRVQCLLKKDFNSLNKFQQKLVTKISNQPTANVLVFSCHICLKDTLKTLKKQKIKTIVKENIDAQNDELLPLRKKKKKKKDKFAGLKAAVVQNYIKPTGGEKKKPVPIQRRTKKAANKLTLTQQIRIQNAVLQTPVPKKKPSLLSTFLESM